MHSSNEPVQGFEATGLSPELLAVLTKGGFTTPTPIQAQSIPVALTGSDLIGIAQTGTGKTMAFGLPTIDRLLASFKAGNRGRALIVVPTRELALQVEESLRKVTRFMSPYPRTACLIGGAPIYKQIKELSQNPSIVIGTPGRLRDHLDQKTLDLSKVTVLILDEADRMLDMGFAPQINAICSFLPEDRQTMLFSATMPPEIEALAAKYQKNPQRIEISRAGTSNANIRQELRYVTRDGKIEALEQLMAVHPGTVLVFSRTKHGAAKLSDKLGSMGYAAAEIHSNRSLGQRRQALDGFKNGRYRVLVATDVAARGIDVHNIGLVVNFDLPDAPDDYVHRIGRTGRAGLEGVAVSFATLDQVKDVRAIERLIKQRLPLSEGSLPEPADFRSSDRSGGRSNGSGYSGSRRPSRPFASSSSSGRPSGPPGGGRGGAQRFQPKRQVKRAPVWGGKFA